MATSPSRIVQSWEGSTGYPLNVFTKMTQKKLLETKSLFCSRKECAPGGSRPTDNTTTRNVIRDPYQAECGHRYCKECVDIIKAMPPGEQKCWPCEQEEWEGDDSGDMEAEPDVYIKIDVNSIRPDKAALKEVMKLEVICPFGCGTQKITMKTLENHKSTCPCRRESFSPSMIEDQRSHLNGRRGLNNRDLAATQGSPTSERQALSVTTPDAICLLLTEMSNGNNAPIMHVYNAPVDQSITHHHHHHQMSTLNEASALQATNPATGDGVGAHSTGIQDRSHDTDPDQLRELTEVVTGLRRTVDAQDTTSALMRSDINQALHLSDCHNQRLRCLEAALPATGIPMLPVAEQADDDAQSENSTDGQGSEMGWTSDDVAELGASGGEDANRREFEIYVSACKICYNRRKRYTIATFIAGPCGHYMYCDMCNADENRMMEMDRRYKRHCLHGGCGKFITKTFKRP